MKNLTTFCKGGFLVFTILIIQLSACKKKETPPPPPPAAPIANFTYTGDNTYASATVDFTSTSTNATSYLWDFGDNGSSTQASPQHIYLNGGVYTVTLTAMGAGGTNSKTKTVNILNRPTTCKITNVKITAMPFVDASSASWDFSSGPDVFFKILDINNIVLVDGTSSRVTDVTQASLPISWNFTTPFSISPLNTDRFFHIWDYDTPDPDDYIGYVGFNPSSYSNYPTSVNISRGSINITLTVTWQ